MIGPFVWLFADEIDLLRMLDLAPMHMMRRRMIHKGNVMIQVLSKSYIWLWMHIFPFLGGDTDAKYDLDHFSDGFYMGGLGSLGDIYA